MQTTDTSRRMLLLKRIGIVLASLLLVLVIVAVFFPWDLLRGPVNRFVSEKTGRKFEITRRLDVGLGLRTATVKLDGIEFANPAWARDPYLVRAERAEIDIRIWPLLASRIVLPRIMLTSPSVPSTSMTRVPTRAMMCMLATT